MNVLKNLKVGALLLMALLPMAVGCGDAHRNDQGVSFLNFGWVNEDKEPVGYAIGCLATAADAVLGSDAIVTGYPPATSVYWLGLQNNLAGEYIRLQRIHHSYHIYGASIQPPDTSSAANGVLTPSNPVQDPIFGGGGWPNGATQPGESTLPDSLANGGSGDGSEGRPAEILYFPTPVITSDISSFLSLNRTALPEPPFTMTVESYAEGVTSAGRRVYSNTGYLEYQILSDNSDYCRGLITTGTATSGVSSSDEESLDD